MDAYIGTKIIVAEPQRHQDGREGYKVIYPDGYVSWSPKETFEHAYRRVSHHERQLLEQSDAEHQVAAISDGEPERACDHIWGHYDVYIDGRRCRVPGCQEVRRQWWLG